MAAFLLIDPAAGRRAGLRVFLTPPHQVVEHQSLRDSLAPCAGQSFKAAFIGWPEAVSPGAAEKITWSCEHAVLLTRDPAQARSASDWCKRVLPQASITLMHCPDGYLNSPEISRAVSRVLDTPAVVFPDMVGSGPEMRQLLEMAARVATNDRPVLICGESGTGKEALARWIHARSARRHRSFEVFDCAGLDLPAALSELFGHEKGAFPWAVQSKQGLLAAANEGTLYIREASQMDPALQSQLLRLLERPANSFRRLGGRETYNVDVRVIAGTCSPLGQRLGEEFSRELYYRLRQNYLETPSLRSRSADIPELAGYLLARQQGAASCGMKWQARPLVALKQYGWPGNVNELDEVVAEVALKIGPGSEIMLEHLPLRIRNAAGSGGFTPAPLPTAANPPPQTPTQGTTAFPEPGFRCDGYRMLKVMNNTTWARVFLAEQELGRVLRVAKFSQARNADQRGAVDKIIALNSEDSQASQFMIPIHHACNCSTGPWYMVVLACLDDARTGHKLNRDLYQPHTLREWITRLHRDRATDRQDRLAVLNHVQEVLRVLDFFHRNDLMMNDVKPENFGFYEGRLVAIDYGPFTFLGQEPHEFTPAYTPPEPRTGRPAEDIYAVVIMMAEALYDLPPEVLTRSTVQRLSETYLSEGRLFDRLVWTMILKGLNPNPNIGYRNAQSMIKQLEELKQKLNEDGEEENGACQPD